MRQSAGERQYIFNDYVMTKKFRSKEIIDGEIIRYAPPRRIHQKVCLSIAAQLYGLLEDTPYEVYTAPFVVRLGEPDGSIMRNSKTVIEPDISVICDTGKLDMWGCKGAPDLIIEILPPKKQGYDTVMKYNLYSDAGIREYWIVDPEKQTAEVFFRDENDILAPVQTYGSNERVRINILGEQYVDLSRVFPDTTIRPR